MEKVVPIEKLQYEFTLIPVLHYEVAMNQLQPDKQVCLIGVKHPLRNRVIIHPFSGFPLQLKKKSYNAMRERAETVIRFLNFVIENNHKYKLKTFSDLNIEQGMAYLDSLVEKGVTEKYRNSEDNNLTKFYNYLAEKELLNFITTADFTWILTKKGDYLATLFPDARSTAKKNPRPLHNIKIDLLPFFLELAMMVVPRIVLGVYFQFMGGLRRSEVCNVIRAGVSPSGSYGEFGMNLWLGNTFQREDLRNRNATSVKKPRTQAIEVFSDYLPRLYKTHLENYLPTDGSGALFSNNKGQALTSRMYTYYFNKLKKAFIKELKSYKDTNLSAYALVLKTMKWGTHIGRGIFSNVMAEVTQDQVLLMLKRGDARPESSEAYMEDTEYRKKQSRDHLDNMYKKGVKKLKDTEEI